MSLDLSYLGITATKEIYRNLPVATLTEKALARGEGTLSNTGALVVKTGKYTGRSANDKFIVDTPAVHDEIAWGKVNRPIDKATYDAIYSKVVAYLQNREIFVFDGFAGADEKYMQRFRIINELASQNLFIHQLLRRPTEADLVDFKPDFTIIAAPGFKCIPEIDGTRSEAAILVNYEEKMVVICGSQYAGEIKKSVFSVMNYILPKMGVFPMHCSANIGHDGDSAVFFGLSGTGKTTLSADPNRKLIGDDEHGWADDSVFNFEGGCYAKCINLSAEKEPDIYNAIKFGALVENVVMDPETREFDFDDDSLAENSRVGYPVEFINNAELSGKSQSVPKTVIFPSPPTPTACCRPSPSWIRTRRCTTSSAASPPSWLAPRSASPRPCRPSPPASASPSCPSIPPCMPACWPRRLRRAAPTSTWSTPAGTAPASA